MTWIFSLIFLMTVTMYPITLARLDVDFWDTLYVHTQTHDFTHGGREELQKTGAVVNCSVLFYIDDV